MKTIATCFIVLLIVPQVAIAAWWNPATWFNSWNVFRKEPTKTQVLENRIAELETKLANTATTSTSTPEGLRENSLTQPTLTDETVKTKIITRPDNSAEIKEQIRIQIESSLKIKAEQDALIARKKAEEQALIDLQKAQSERQAVQEASQLRLRQEEYQRQLCLSTFDSRAQIQQEIDAIISQLTSTAEASKASIRNSYDSQIQSLREARQRELTSMLEQGGGSASYAISLYKSDTDAQVADLEARKTELLRQADALLAQNISSVQQKALGLFQNSREAKCGI